jgi:hypothetical protein
MAAMRARSEAVVAGVREEEERRAAGSGAAAVVLLAAAAAATAVVAVVAPRLRLRLWGARWRLEALALRSADAEEALRPSTRP